MAVIAGVAELLRRLTHRRRPEPATPPAPRTENEPDPAPVPRTQRAAGPAPESGIASRPVRTRPEPVQPPPPRPDAPRPRSPEGSENCADCARLWAASGYDATVRCAVHRR